MRLLFVSRSLPFHHIGGMESVAWDLARALARRGHEVEILTTPAEALEPESMREGVCIRTVDAPSARYSGAFWRETLRRFEHEYARRIDLVLSIGAGAYEIARARRRGDRPPVVMQSHGQAWGELTSKLRVPSPVSWLKAVKNAQGVFIDRVLRRFDAVIAIGPAVETVMRTPPTRWMLGATPVFVIVNGIDEDRFAFDPAARARLRQQLGIPADAPVLMSASRLHVQKGVKDTLSGFARAREGLPALQYVIAGAGPAEAELRAHAEALRQRDAVHFAGAVTRDVLPQLLSAVDVFAFTSHRREGLALGPLEAAASGLPCVLSAHLAVPGLDASLVDPRDTAAIAQAIAHSCGRLQADRHSLLPPDYSLRVATERYERLFTDIIAGEAGEGGAQAAR